LPWCCTDCRGALLPYREAVSNPTPALVTERGARRLPRSALLLLCAAYVLPGVVGRDPWRGADVTAFGQMVALAEGRTSWLAPALGGVAADAALLPHWLGAAFVAQLGPALGPALAARLPFAVLLALVLALAWYTTFHLARTEAAQPVPFAFGGEAEPVAYARAMADGAVLALMATLGLLQLGHETTPELMQLAGVGLLLYGLAAAPFRLWKSRLAVLGALPLLAISGAPSMALALGAGALLVCVLSTYLQVRRFALWVAAGTALAAVLATAIDAWHWRAGGLSAAALAGIARQWAWFLWPAWPLALWTLWRWRRHLRHRHLSVPLVAVTVALSSNLAMGGSDRALMLGLPGMAVLAAFALPTLKRSASAAIDWFSMIFFTLGALTIWVVYSSLQIGVPAKPAANVARLAVGYESSFSWPALVLALLGSAAWVAVVRWRTGRHREALWKSLVLPAGGVALCWLLLMTLWLPLLDYARSPRPWVQRVAEHVPPGACISAPGLTPSVVAALEHFGGWRVDARPEAASTTPCSHSLRITRGQGRPQAAEGWVLQAVVTRPTERDELTSIFRRADR
jgi:4-amino-4-deoxy-L-arabinose transferase-like glycosyltransferase